MKVKKLYYSIKYTDWRRVSYRLWYVIKRHFSTRFNYVARWWLYKGVESKPISKDAPLPIFPMRSGKVIATSDSNQFYSLKLRLLNQEELFHFPIEWHRKSLNTGTRLWKLNFHYHEFLEELPTELFIKVILDWIDNNPPYKHDYWKDSWNSYSISIRVVVWMQQIALRKNELQESFIDSVNHSLLTQIHFLCNNLEKDIRGNHIIKNAKALIWASQYFAEVSWQIEAENILNNELSEQILSDGVHFELSPTYHVQVMADIMECYPHINNQILKEKVLLILGKMNNALNAFIHPDDQISLFNDGAFNLTYSPTVVKETYYKLFNSKIYSVNLINLENAGYFGLKNDECYFLMDAGRVGPDELPAHAHGDIFSFEWSLPEGRFIVDKGVYEYSESDKRKSSRATRSHNTVTLDEYDQCEFWGSFRMARRANVIITEKQLSDSEIVIDGSHDGFKRLKGNPIHRRKLSFTGTELFVQDEIVNGAGQVVKSSLLLHPDIKYTLSDSDLVFQIGSKKFKMRTKAIVNIVPDEWFPEMGLSRKTVRVELKYGVAPTKGYYHIHEVSI